MSDKKIPCKHENIYHTNKECLYLAISSNCKDCYLSLFSQLSDERNIKINSMKVFAESRWKRGKDGRLFRKRDCFNINFNCPSLGIDCSCPLPKGQAKEKMHLLKSTKIIPKMYSIDRKKSLSLSHACVPRYQGQSEGTYKKTLRKQTKKVDKINRKYKNIVKRKQFADFFYQIKENDLQII